MPRKTSLSAPNIAALLAAFLLLACGTKKTVDPRLASDMPQTIVWAWERPEDLSDIDPGRIGVAVLAQTILLEQDRVIPKSRRQSIKIADGAYVIAVTRIETNKETGKRPVGSDEQVDRTAALIVKTLELPNIRAVQIDFDAVTSERSFYRRLMNRVRSELDKAATAGRRVPLTMTSLASWCTGDAWFNDFPVDEAVPMVFQMGADEDKIRTYLRNGNDWAEPLCRGSYGLSIDAAPVEGLRPGRRTYLFSKDPWTSRDLEKAER